jgi:hypothetical protein
MAGRFLEPSSPPGPGTLRDRCLRKDLAGVVALLEGVTTPRRRSADVRARGGAS